VRAPAPDPGVALTLRADWVQIVEWCYELVHLADGPVARLNGAVAVGQARACGPA
jgi:predicted RNA polymerase sigma factor